MNLAGRDISTLQMTFSLCHLPPDKLLFESWSHLWELNQEQAPLGQL